jgi:protein-disulfide isomerase
MLVGMVMLLVGLVAGYVGRPIIESRTNPNSDQAGQASASLNDLVISNTRHFIGNPDAPVTIIEFSDFQ